MTADNQSPNAEQSPPAVSVGSTDLICGGDKLTPEQIENWRRVLVQMVGPYAFMAPAIQRMKDTLQARITKPHVRVSESAGEKPKP